MLWKQRCGHGTRAVPAAGHAMHTQNPHWHNTPGTPTHRQPATKTTFTSDICACQCVPLNQLWKSLQILAPNTIETPAWRTRSRTRTRQCTHIQSSTAPQLHIHAHKKLELCIKMKQQPSNKKWQLQIKLLRQRRRSSWRSSPGTTITLRRSIEKMCSSTVRTPAHPYTHTRAPSGATQKLNNNTIKRGAWRCCGSQDEAKYERVWA